MKIHDVSGRPAWLRPAALLALLAGALAGGCSLPQAQPDLTRYYVLTTSAPANAAAPATAAAGPRIFVRAVNLPDYLRGRIMAVRLGPNEVRYIDEARWAEPLEPGLARVLREDLSQRDSVRTVLRPTDDHDFDIVVQVRHCEGVLPGRVGRLAGHIEVSSAGLDSRLVASDEFALDVGGWDGRDYAQLAGKLSEAAGAMADRIASLLPQKKP